MPVNPAPGAMPLSTSTGGGFLRTLGGGVRGIASWIKENPLASGMIFSGISSYSSHQAQLDLIDKRNERYNENRGRKGTYFEIDQEGNVYANATYSQDSDDKILTDPKSYVDGTADRLAHAKRYPVPQTPMSEPTGVPDSPIDTRTQSQAEPGQPMPVGSPQLAGAPPGTANPWMPVSNIPWWEQTEVPT